MAAVVAATGFAVLTLAAGPARAVMPDEMLKNPAQEARAERIGSQLRCLVCQNESIEESNAGLAHDLRMLIRHRVEAGDSDRQIIAYIRARYGDFVLLRPPFQTDTLLLWGGPFLVLALGALGVVGFYARRRSPPVTPPLSPEEERRLSALLDEGTRP